jgi:hypothetical protein
MEVSETQRVTLENMAVGSEDSSLKSSIDIHQNRSNRSTRTTYDGVYVYGMYRKQPFRKGLWFTGLGPGDTVVLPHAQGNLHFVDCGRATVLANCTYEGSVVVEGKNRAREGFLGFQTRLATIVPFGLYLRDSQSIVMSDYYVEQSDSGYWFEGNPGDPPGRATLQGAKVEFTVPKGDPAHNVTIDIHDYRGQIFFGPYQFYMEPKRQRIVQQGAGSVELFLVGCSWYDSSPDIDTGSSARTSVIGNDAFGMQTVQYSAGDEASAQALSELSLALDDLRRLGEVDLRLNYPETATLRARSLKLR